MIEDTETYKPNRNRLIYHLRQAGYTLQHIGDRFGVGKERVRNICAKEQRLINRELKEAGKWK